MGRCYAASASEIIVLSSMWFFFHPPSETNEPVHLEWANVIMMIDWANTTYYILWWLTDLFNLFNILYNITSVLFYISVHATIVHIDIFNYHKNNT